MEDEFTTGCLDRKGDIQDPRNYKFSELVEALPPEARVVPYIFMDLKEKLSKVGYQNWGSCTSWGSVNGIKEYQEEEDLSEYFNYVNSKIISGIYNQQGEYIVNALKAICNYGVCKAGLFPDIRGNTWLEYVKKKPSDEAYKDAETRKGKTYWEVGSVPQSFKEAIYLYNAPVIFAMDWNRSYNKTPADGRLPLPTQDWVGGHCMAAIGWDEKGIWVKNSWGESWGNKGFFYIPYEDWGKHNISTCQVLLDLPKKNMSNVKIVKNGNESGFYVPARDEASFIDKAMNFGKEVPLTAGGGVDWAKVNFEGTATINQ